MQDSSVELKIAIVFNDPTSDRYDEMGEAKAVFSVMEEVRPVYRALSELGYTVVKVPLRPPLELVEERLRALEVDLVFNLFEGFEGRPETEATVAGMLSELGIPFTGNPASALLLSLDKVRAKTILAEGGIRTPKYQTLSPENLHLFSLNFPCIVKPIREDASHGLSEESVVNDLDQLASQVSKISQHFRGASLVEEFLEGREFNVTVLGNSKTGPIVLPVAEIVYYLPPEMPKLLTFAAKWHLDSQYYKGTKATCPAEIEDSEKELISLTASTAFRLLGCCGYARVDMRMDAEGILNVLEVNPNPDISPGYGAARQAKAAGMTYKQFIEKIVMLALEEHSLSRVLEGVSQLDDSRD
jgi:D-alanine-D-alanine ligase